MHSVSAAVLGADIAASDACQMCQAWASCLGRSQARLHWPQLLLLLRTDHCAAGRQATAHGSPTAQVDSSAQLNRSEPRRTFMVC